LEFEFFEDTDNLGNPILTSPNQLAGQLKVNMNTLPNYRSAVSRFHFTFTSDSFSVPSGNVTIVDCVVDPKTKEVVCKSVEP